MAREDDLAFDEYLKKMAASLPEEAPTKSKKSETYWSDMPTKVGMGILSLGRMGVNAAVGNDNKAYDFLTSEIERGKRELSPEQRRQDAEVAATLADDNKGALDVVGSMISNPRASAGMIAESLPSMFAGGGVGGILARGAGAVLGTVGRAGTLAAAGLGEGTIMAADVFDKTGSGEAALKALALGTVTGFIPGNVEATLTRKFAGEAVEGISDVVVPGMAKAGFVGATKRAAGAIGAESGQEFLQESGQALIEQEAGGGPLNLHSAMKQGVAGAVVGGVMGGGMHAVGGEGSKAAELASAEQVLAQNPTNPVAQAEVSLLRAQLAYVNATPAERPELKTAIDVAKAAVLAARMPGNRAAEENLDTARGEAVLDAGGMTGARVAADAVSAETQRAITESQSVDEAIQSFAEGSDTHSIPTTVARSIQNVRDGVALAETQLADDTYDANEEAQKQVEKEIEQADKERAKQQQEAVKAATQAAKLEQAKLKLQQEREKLGLASLPTINADLVPESTGEQAQPGRAAFIAWQVRGGASLQQAEIRADSFTQVSDEDLQRTLDDTTRSPEVLAYAREIAAQRYPGTPAPAQSPRDAYIAEYDEHRAGIIEAMGIEALQAMRANIGVSQVARDYAGWLINNRQQAPADTEIIGARRTQSTVAEAERRFRTIAQQNGETDTRTEESIAGYRRDAMNEPVSTIERDIQSLEDANMHTHAELLRALLDERENAQQQPAATEPAPVPGSTIGIRNMRLRVEAARRHFISALEAEGQSNADANRNADLLLMSNNLEAIAQDTRNDFEAAEYAQAILDQRAATGGSAQSTQGGGLTGGMSLQLAIERAEFDGLNRAAIDSILNTSARELANMTHDISRARTVRELAYVKLINNGELPLLTWDQFQDREDELDASINALINRSPGVTRRNVLNHLTSMTEEALGNLAEGRTTINEHLAEQSRIARTAIAFRNKTYLGDFYPAGSSASVAGSAAPAARPRDEIERDYNEALNDWADSMNATLTIARRHVEALSDERVMEGLADPDLAPFMLPVAEYRGLAIPTNLQIAPPVANPVTREVTLDFGERAMNALHNGVLDKLGDFWTKVMQGRGQRVFNINTRDLANVANGFRELTQDQLNTLMDRYNDELNRQAQQWATDHNQTITTLVNPIVSITNTSGDIYMKVRSLGRQGQNPYAVPQNDMAVGSASISKRDGHMTTTELAVAKGSSNLAYRLAAEIGRMAGHNIPAASSLLTNNRMRRHMQSVYADSLFGPGHLSPMESGGYESYQGVPRDVWEAARTDNQRIGLNILRAAHQGTENRHGGIVPISRFIENLSYNSRGEIVATSDPKHRRGWPKGTVVTEAMLTQRLLEKDMDFNFNSSYDSTTYDPGNRSNTGETAMGRSGAGGVGADTAKFMIMTNTILNRIENDPSATIPRAWLDRAKKIGREMGGWMFSEAEQGGAKGISADDAIARVVDMVGNNAAKVLLESGMIDFVQTGAELTGETFSDSNGKVQGATTPDGKIILVLNNLTDKTFDGVLSHEAIHATLKNLLGDDTYNTLMSRLDTLLKAGEGSQWVKEANARVPAGTNPQDRLEEIAGYAVELHVRGGVRGNPLVQWAKDFMSALRTAIIKNDSMPKWLKDWAVENVQPADLTRMAMSGLKRAAVKTEADLKPNLKATSINVGLTVGMGETAEVLTPEFVRAEIEKLGVKVGRSNVVDASYEHQGEIVRENTFVAELDRALTPAEVERLAINTKQQAIPQRVNGIGGLYGPKASEWGGFSAHEFRELNGQRSDEVARQSQVTYAPVDTKSPAFKRWFGKSVVVNADGTPKLMYHGTEKNFDTFKVDSELGAHFGPIDQAERFADIEGGNMMPVYISIKKPLRLIDKAHWDGSGLTGQLKDLGILSEELYNFAMTLENKPGPMSNFMHMVLRDAGYDGIVYLNRYESPAFDKQIDDEGMMPDDYGTWTDEQVKAAFPGSGDSYIIFKPTQVKSAISNTGEFSKKDGDIRMSRWRDWDAEIKALMEEHRDPKTTNARRSKINEELRSARMFQRADREVRYQNATGQLFSVGASYGTPREGAVSVVGVHFGNTSRNVLNSVAYGKGIKGEEAARLQGQNDIRPRTMFYVDEGNGIIKEPGLGNVGKQVRLNNLYDLREDALNLGSNDLNKMERAIVAAGFDGYYRPNYRDMGQGTVVMVGKHDIPVEPYVPGEGAAPAPAYTGNQYAEALAKSKLPGGSMLGREWLVALRNSEFDTPPVRAALEQRQDQRIYRDDLPGFNRGLRFSISEEHAAVEPPVSDALPNELNILDLGRRPGTERMLEKTRAAIQDKHVTLRRIQQLAKVVSEMVGIDTIGALERMSSKLMAEQRRLVDAPLAKIENILSNAGYAAEDARTSLDKLLIARHAPEYNEHTATINPAKYDSNGKYLGGHDAKHPGSGVTDQQAAETVRLLTSGESAKTKALLEAEGVYRQMIADLQAFAVDRGLETQQTIDNWNKKFPYYTPFNRELNLEENNSVGSMPGSAGLSLRSGIARRAMGSAADIISPLASTTLWGLKTTQRGENAVVARTFLAFANFVTPNYVSANGEKKPMWVTEKVPTQRVIKRLKVYRVTKADGTMSPEFYNLEKARAYADMQQAMWEQQNPDADPETSGITPQVQYDGEPQNRVVIQPTPNYLNQPNVMVIPVEGENVIITFDDKSTDGMAILNAFKNKAGSGEAAQTLNKMLTIPRMFSRWVMATATGYNPVFMVFNAARDIQAAALNAGADKIPGWTAKDSAHIATGWMGAAKEILVQLEHEFKQLHDNNYTAPTPASNSMGEWVDRMVAAGGATGITHSIVDMESAETQMRRLYGQDLLNKAKPIGSPNDLLTNFNEGVAKVGDAFYRFGQGETKLKFMSALSKHVVARTARLNEAAELTTRALVFKRATELYVQAGHDVETAEKLAANISKNISTNFNRRGNWTNILNQVFPFFNAAANGTARLAETLFEKGTYTKEIKVTNKDTGESEVIVVTDQNTKLTPYGKKVAGALASIGVLQAALLLAAGFDDDDIPENVKERAFIIPIPFSTDRDYFAIPMPHGFNLLVNAGRNLTDAGVHLATGEYGKAANRLYMGTLGQIGALNPTGSAGNPVTDMLPAIVDPIVSLYMNKDAFGRPIAKEDLNPANPTPGFTRVKEGASKTARMLSEGLNTLTGGNDDQKGAFSPTPDQIDFVLGQIGGGVGRELTKAGSALKAGYDMAAGNEREPMPSYKMPLIGRLYGNADEPSSLRAKLFTVRTELNETYARYKGLKDRGDREGAAAFKAEHPEISLRDDVERYARGNAKQTKARALARDQDEIGKVNEITNKQDSKVADLLRKYEELK